MSTLFNFLAIALAGALGSSCRYGMNLAAASVMGGSSLWGTALVNVLGCALLGGIFSLEQPETESQQRLMLAIQVGFLGSLTTFSTFAAESAGLALEGRWGVSSAYVLANLILGWAVLLLASAIVKGWVQT